MNKFFVLTSLLSCAFILSACEKPEAALTDDEVSPAQDQSAPQNTGTPIQIHTGRAEQTTVKTPPPHQAKSESKPEITIAQAVPPATEPAHTTPFPIKTTPFKVRRCINMGNALEAPNEGDWGYSIRAQDLQAVAQAGFDTIRLPVRWDTHTGHRPPYTIDPAFMARVKTVVAQAQSFGLGVIIDVHHYENLMSRTNREQPRFLAIWDQIARTFSNAPDNVYFEVLNEPTRAISHARLNALYSEAIPVIRASNPRRKIILGGNSWNSIETLTKVRWPLYLGKRDANLVATFHDYSPHKFTHQGAEWIDPKMPLGRRWGTQADVADLKLIYKLASDFKTKTGLPVFVGEFGVIDKVPGLERMAWTKTRRKAMEANGMSWCVWDFSGAFKIYDTNTNSWYPGAKDALFGR